MQSFKEYLLKCRRNCGYKLLWHTDRQIQWNTKFWSKYRRRHPWQHLWKARNDARFCPFCLNLTSFPTFLTLQDKHNMRTLSLNIKFICTGLKSSPKARYSACQFVLKSFLEGFPTTFFCSFDGFRHGRTNKSYYNDPMWNV
jgi:hypothetical protein